MAKYGKIWQNIAKYSKILENIAKYCKKNHLRSWSETPFVLVGLCTCKWGTPYSPPLTRISCNMVFSKSQNARKAGTLCRIKGSKKNEKLDLDLGTECTSKLRMRYICRFYIMHISLQNFITILKINRFFRGLALFSHEKKQLNFQIEGQFLLLQKFNHVVHANLVQMLMLQLYKFKK